MKISTVFLTIYNDHLPFPTLTGTSGLPGAGGETGVDGLAGTSGLLGFEIGEGEVLVGLLTGILPEEGL